jgi:hypothetical protein
MYRAFLPGVNLVSVRHATNTVRQPIDQATQSGRGVAERERWWLVPFGRTGFAANGLVYVIVGALAGQAALGRGGDTTDLGGALGHLLQAPMGRLTVGAVGIGLAGYAVWRLLQALLDSEHKGTAAAGIVQRVGFAVSAVSYAALAAAAVGMALQRAGQPNEDQSAQDRTAWLMSQPFGMYLVILVGLVILGVAIAQVVQGYHASFEEKIHEQQLGRATRRVVRAAGRLGYIARGIAFGVIGGCVVTAGWQTDPDQARGLGGALAAIGASPFGPWLLGIMAAGLIGYGTHMLIAARYREMVIS